MGSQLRRSLTLLMSLMLFASLAVDSPSASARFDVAGTTYTSPSHGYTITWSNAWFFVDEGIDSTGFDYLVLSDGISYAQFFGGPNGGLTPQQELNSIVVGWGAGEGTSNFQPMLDAQGTPVREIGETRATATYTMTQTFDDGTSADITTRFEIQTLGEGLSLASVFDVPSYAYTGYDPLWSELLTGVVSAGGTLPEPAPDTVPDPVDDTKPVQPPDEVEIPSTLGEPAPVVVSSQWRFAIASTTIGADIPSLDLQAKQGREWLVIFADVTNWSDLDATFSLRDPLVQTAQMAEPFDLAPSSTRQVARLLGMTSQGNDSADIAAGATARIVLAYSIPAAGTETRLLLVDEVLPIAGTFDLAFDPATLPGVSAPPLELEEGVIAGFNGGSSIDVTVAGVETEITLIGANVPATGSCYALQALAELSQYTGASVLLESDAALTAGTDRYVWIVNPDGTKALLNQLLLEVGTARYTSTPNAARFAAWLQGTEGTAQESGAGLWTTCGV